MNIYSYSNLTAEDAAIRRNLMTFGTEAERSYGLGHARDEAIMAELAHSSREIGRATLCPVTLASIGLPAAEYRAIAKAKRLDREARELAALAERHRILAAFKAGASSVLDLEYCPHGQAFDTAEHCDARHTCSDCAQSIAEDSEVPADWFAGGFAPNH